MATTWVPYLATSQWIIMKHSISLTTLFLDVLIQIFTITQIILWQHIDLVRSYEGNKMVSCHLSCEHTSKIETRQ